MTAHVEKKVLADAFAVGMFVSALDRPWIDTPFLLQGFLVETEEEVAQLRRYCQFVYVDLARSVGPSFEHDRSRALKLAAEAAEPRVVTVTKQARQRRAEIPRGDTAVAERPVASERASEPPPEARGKGGRGRPRRPSAPAGRGAPTAEAPSRWMGPISAEEAAFLGRSSRSKDPTSGKARKERIASAFGLGWVTSVIDWFRRSETPHFDYEPVGPPREETPRIIVYREVASIADEMPRAKAALTRTETVLKQVVADVERGGAVHLEKAEAVVGELVDSMVRNPNATLWLSRLKDVDQRAYSHSLQTAIYMVALGLHLGLGREELTHLSVAGLMLDMGKIRVPKGILDKPGKLTDAEFGTIKEHVQHGLNIIAENATAHRKVIDAVARHHEREDGSGYPHGLKGESIGLHGRIAGIVDTFVALTNERSYAKMLTPHDGLRELYRWRGTQFHEPLVEQFIQSVGVFPVGSMVELTSGDVAVVIAHNRVRRLKPRVLLLTGPDKTLLTRPIALDLLYAPAGPNNQDITIARALPAGAYGIDPYEYYIQ